MIYTFVGNIWRQHLIKEGYLIQVSFYEGKKDYLVCVSEIESKLAIKPVLGARVPYSLLVPFIKRKIEITGTNRYNGFKKIMNIAFKEGDIDWLT